MFGFKELKPKICIAENTVDCPVNDCKEKVDRQRHKFRRDDRFKCPKHGIFISPSTFEYEDYKNNLLWKAREDVELLENIFREKRESRIARDNSEDAVTWNVFRFLEKNNLIEGLLTNITGASQTQGQITYWSYSQQQRVGDCRNLLSEARAEFGEEEGRGSEPGLIIKTDKTLFFIEAKFASGNDTPSDKKQIEKKINNPKNYKTGGDNWFGNVFKSTYKEIISEQKYELLRFWLLGTWIAQKLGLRFYLVNLTLADKEKDIEEKFKKHIKEDENKRFLRLTWEGVYEYASTVADSSDKQTMLDYLKNKCVYKNRTLQKVFSV